MPLYSYRCADCAKECEMLMGTDEKPICPACGGARLERLVSFVAPEPKSRGLVRSARAQATREGHFSHYGKDGS